MTVVPDDERLTRYLLGELTGADEVAIEEVLDDDQVWDAVQRLEDDLLDAYASGRLDADRRGRLGARIAASPRLRDRLALHEDLGRIARSRRRRSRTPIRLVAMAAVAMAAALALVVVVRDGGPAAGDRVVALTLAPTTRSGETPAVRPGGGDILVLRIVMDAEEAFPRYRVELLGAAPRSWEVAASGGVIELRMPASELAAGVHSVEIRGLGGADAVRLGTRSFRVMR
jgi:hypothetical protein